MQSLCKILAEDELHFSVGTQDEILRLSTIEIHQKFLNDNYLSNLVNKH